MIKNTCLVETSKILTIRYNFGKMLAHSLTASKHILSSVCRNLMRNMSMDAQGYVVPSLTVNSVCVISI
jgi:hypothetical protein